MSVIRILYTVINGSIIQAYLVLKLVAIVTKLFCCKSDTWSKCK